MTYESLEKRLERIEEKLDNLIEVYRIEHSENPVGEMKAPKPEFCEYCGKAHWGACTSDDLRAAAAAIVNSGLKAK